MNSSFASVGEQICDRGGLFVLEQAKNTCLPPIKVGEITCFRSSLAGDFAHVSWQIADH
jgi:hypothetical protein